MKIEFPWPRSVPVLVPPNQVAAWRSDLVDYWNQPVEQADRRIIRLGSTYWWVKFKPVPEELHREQLAWRLGRGWTNVAEIRPVTRRGLETLRQAGVYFPGWANEQHTVLVRLAQGCAARDLPVPGLDEAVAAELVFSLWIRRRDAHAANRAYTEQVPVFFDHQTAFLSEPELADLEGFFRAGPDAGHASRWRVAITPPGLNLTTAEARRQGQARELALHWIHDRARFEAALQAAAARVRSFSGWTLLRYARAAGFAPEQAREIAAFLDQSSREIGRGIAWMKEFLY